MAISNNFELHSRHDNPFPAMGMGMENYIPEFREWEWKIAFPTFGNGNEKLIPKLWEREWEAGTGIPAHP